MESLGCGRTTGRTISPPSWWIPMATESKRTAGVDMPTIYKEVITQASPAAVWDAIRDIGALHTRLVPGFVVATALVPGGRRVTFASGMVIEEPIIESNDHLRRLVWTVVGG